MGDFEGKPFTIDYYVLEAFRRAGELGLFNVEDRPDGVEIDGVVRFELAIPLAKLRPILRRERLDAVRVDHLERAVAEADGAVARYNNRVEVRLATVRSGAAAFVDRPVVVDLVVPSEESSLFVDGESAKWADDLRDGEIWDRRNIDLSRARVTLRFCGAAAGVPPGLVEEARQGSNMVATGAVATARESINMIMISLKFLPKVKGDTRPPPKPSLVELDAVASLRGLLVDVPLSRRPIVIEKHGNFDTWARIPLVGGDPSPDDLKERLEAINVRAATRQPHTFKAAVDGERVVWVQLDHKTAEDFSREQAPWWRVEEISPDERLRKKGSTARKKVGAGRR